MRFAEERLESRERTILRMLAKKQHRAFMFKTGRKAGAERAGIFA